MLRELAAKSKDAIALHYVPLDDLLDTFLDGNSKKHDTDKIVESILRYGFRDPIAFDPALNEGQGGVVEGNGRLESLKEMRAQNKNTPRGVKDNWDIPVIFGVNSASESEAIAYSIEHNWSVLWGSEADLEDILSMFDEAAIADQLKGLDEANSLPISIDMDLEELLEDLEPEEADTPNYDILDDSEVEAEAETFADEVRKSIQIEFKPDDYDHAYGIVTQARKAGIYSGEVLVSRLEELLSAEAEKG